MAWASIKNWQCILLWNKYKTYIFNHVIIFCVQLIAQYIVRLFFYHGLYKYRRNVPNCWRDFGKHLYCGRSTGCHRANMYAHTWWIWMLCASWRFYMVINELKFLWNKNSGNTDTQSTMRPLEKLLSPTQRCQMNTMEKPSLFSMQLERRISSGRFNFFLNIYIFLVWASKSVSSNILFRLWSIEPN